ncbi:hypothetical protein CALCODRAFT_499388 [Calocera cornea HHB12733]|uniref:F-box domain-containing protein n=1 Tax=Calocera cornea HHB12733 TaxID=1353952 RepID=A0A165EG06_9BASI|nr:hypothetical protein CALCODRAFT_499388 [Calocera cornea HHB12733]
MPSVLSPAPIYRIPSELLSIIFELAHADASRRLCDTWWSHIGTRNYARDVMRLLATLCTVSHTWRNLALSLPRLWMVIPIINLQDGPFALEDFVARSSSLPLTVVASGPQEHKYEALQAVTQSHILSRIHRVNIATPHADMGSHGVVATTLTRHFPAMEHVAFADLFGELHSQWIILHAEQLVSMKMDHFFASGLGFPRKVSFARLERLILNVYSPETAPLLTHGVFPLLVELHLGGASTNECPSHPLPSLRLLALRTINFDGYLLTLRFLPIAPSLECIIFTGDKREKERLLAKFCPATETEEEKASPIHAPQLQRLILRGGGQIGDSILKRAMKHRAGSVLPHHDWTIELEHVTILLDE